MTHTSIDHVLENQSLKFEFELRNLDLSEVLEPVWGDLARENWILRNLLKWVQRYSECGDRATMEAEGYHFPPIYPDIGPDNDWFRFEEWMQGKPICQTLKERLAPSYTPKNPEGLTDEEIISEIEALCLHLAELRYRIAIWADVPPRLLYAQLLDYLEEVSQTIIFGYCTFDGCTGYCPGCFQRPWCETGNELCWPEDEEAGEMQLIDAVKAYVSASPMSLAILRDSQAKKDREFEEFRKRQAAREYTYVRRERPLEPPEPFPRPLGELDIPF